MLKYISVFTLLTGIASQTIYGQEHNGGGSSGGDGGTGDTCQLESPYKKNLVQQPPSSPDRTPIK